MVAVKQIIFITIPFLNDFDWMIISKKVKKIPKILHTQLMVDCDWMNYIITTNCSKTKHFNDNP